MNDVVARIADAVVELNRISQVVSDNPETEFDLDMRLNVLDVAVDDLGTSVEDTVELLEDTTE